MYKIVVALDWTPNINHVGFFIARDLGFYEELGIVVDINDPSEDNYLVTPAKKVELGKADFALCPMESIISYRTKAIPFNLIATATIYKEDLSAIVSLKGSGLTSPKTLDQKRYASYKARYEDEIVKQMIKNDGGLGELIIDYPEKLGIWDTLLNGVADSTWVFMNWEGVHADTKGIELNAFRMKDFQIPYSYSPVIAANAEVITEKREHYEKFLKASKKGFLYAKNNPLKSSEILKNYIPKNDKDIDILKCIEMSSSSLGNSDTWGIMAPENVERYLKWIYDHKLETKILTFDEISTNELLH